MRGNSVGGRPTGEQTQQHWNKPGMPRISSPRRLIVPDSILIQNQALGELEPAGESAASDRSKHAHAGSGEISRLRSKRPGKAAKAGDDHFWLYTLGIDIAARSTATHFNSQTRNNLYFFFSSALACEALTA
ncbi:hypothetical protein DL89DRAFT_270325, partial [Linderina pennispora]